MKKLQIVLFAIGLLACSRYQAMENEQIRNAFALNSSPTFKGYFYEGSDQEYHYFISKWDYEKDAYFKIPISELNISPDFKFDKGQNELRVDLIAGNHKLFAKNEFYKLYVIANK